MGKQGKALFYDLGEGNFRPTDIDGITIIGDFLLIVEMKHGNTDMPFGQQLALTRIADSWRASGKESMVALASHRVGDTKKAVTTQDLTVTKYYYGGKWKEVEYSLVDVINKIKRDNE